MVENEPGSIVQLVFNGEQVDGQCGCEGRCSSGSSRAAARSCSRSSRAARASGSRRSRPARRVSGVIVRWRAISVPWSQVIDRRSVGGRSVIRAVRASWRASPWRCGRCRTGPSGPSFDECADRRGLVLADDQVALPMPGSDRSSGGNGRSWMVSIGCWNRGRRRSTRVLLSPPMIPASAQRGSIGAEPTGRAQQCRSRLVDGLVDALVDTTTSPGCSGNLRRR